MKQEATKAFFSPPPGWVEWIEPFGPNNEPVFMRVEEATAIAVMKKMHPELSDDEALDEFIVVHWAERGSNNPTRKENA